MVLDKNLNTVISVDFETSEQTPFTVRVTSDDQISIYGVIEHITKQARRNCIRTWLDYKKANSEVTIRCDSFKFKGRGQQFTPVAKWETILKIILELPGKRAGAFRSKSAKCLAKHLMPKSWSVEQKVKKLAGFFNQLPPELKKQQPEDLVVSQLQSEWGGEREVECEAGFIDLLTQDKIIEVKNIINWKHAIGQVICYGIYFPYHQKTIVLFGGNECINKEIIEQTCISQNIQLYYK
jgi:hypothetical protein